MAKVNVKNIAILVHHDVVRIAVANAEYESGNAVAGTGMSECSYCLFVSAKWEMVYHLVGHVTVKRVKVFSILLAFVFLFDPLV